MREFSGLFRPERVAVVGATPREGSIGRAVMANLVEGFEGDVVPVNPNYGSVLDRDCVPDVGAAGDVDLAVIVVPAAAAVDVLREAGEAGVRNAVVITAGFGEVGEEGAERERELRDVARTHDVSVVGPNSLGIMSTPVGLNATFSPLSPLEGSVSMLSQSGAFVTAAVDWATDRGIGFRDVVSLGNEAVVSETDLIEYWGADPGTDVIVGYLEGIDDGREFVDRVREVTAETPVVLLKSGRSAAGAAAAASHTGSMAGSDRAYETGFRQAGVLRPDTVEGLFDAAATLSGAAVPDGNGVGVVTNAGGPGVLASDEIAESRLSLASFGEETVARLEEVLPSNASPRNPVDVVGDADVGRFAAALEAVFDDDAVDSVLLLSAPTAVFTYDELAEAIVEARGEREQPMVTCLMGGDRTESAAERLRSVGVPNYFDPARAVRSLDALAAYDAVRGREYGEPMRFDVDESAIREVLERAAVRGDDRVSVEAMTVLDACGVPTPPGELADSPEAAAAVARRIGGPLAMKVASPDVLHKSDVGGVELDVPVARAAGTYVDIVERVEERQPGAEVLGVQVERMVPPDHGVETIVGVTRDPQFGPLVMFGLGGIFVEVFEDVAFRVAPVSEREALAMTEEIDAAGMLRGARGQEPVDLDAVVETIGRLGQLALEFPEVRELDVNPLLATADGVTALDFRLAFDPDVR
jgi:acetyltransferase